MVFKSIISSKIYYLYWNGSIVQKSVVLISNVRITITLISVVRIILRIDLFSNFSVTLQSRKKCKASYIGYTSFIQLSLQWRVISKKNDFVEPILVIIDPSHNWLTTAFFQSFKVELLLSLLFTSETLNENNFFSQTNAAADFLRRHYPPQSSSASHATPEEEVSEIDQRIRLIEQDSRLLEAEDRRSRSPSPVPFDRHLMYRQFSPERHESATPVRATNSVLPLNLSKAPFLHESDDHLHFSVDHEPPLRREASPEHHHEHRVMTSPHNATFRDSATPQAFKPSPPSSHTSSPPPGKSVNHSWL